MKGKMIILIPLLFAALTISLCCRRQEDAGWDEFPELTGLYLGQKPPGDQPELFAPGIVSTGMFTRDIAMTPDGKEIYFCVAAGPYTYTAIMKTSLIGDLWTRPEVTSFSSDPDIMDLEPFVSPDGKKMFFLSGRPDPANGRTAENQDIWVMDRARNGWSEPYNLGAPINTEHAEFFPSVTREGTMYFTRSETGSRENFIYRSRWVDGKYSEPERLPDQVNSGSNRYNAFIAPDESYIIVPIIGREDSFGGTDYYVCFRTPEDTWSEPINMGEKVNTAGNGEFSPYVSPDGKYFFFMSSRLTPEKSQPQKLTLDNLRKVHLESGNGYSDIYWMDASFIQDLRTQAKEPEIKEVPISFSEGVLIPVRQRCN